MVETVFIVYQKRYASPISQTKTIFLIERFGHDHNRIVHCMCLPSAYDSWPHLKIALFFQLRISLIFWPNIDMFVCNVCRLCDKTKKKHKLFSFSRCLSRLMFFVIKEPNAIIFFLLINQRKALQLMFTAIQAGHRKKQQENRNIIYRWN